MSQTAAHALSVVRDTFDTLPDGRPVERYRLTNRAGLSADILTHGARLQALRVPDRNGRIEDVLLGFDRATDYDTPGSSYFGATIGRYGNRIRGAAFELAGARHQLSANEGSNTLHGGERGFDRRIWAAAPINAPDHVGVELTLFSPDGDMGFPGHLAVTLRYTLDDAGRLALHYSAVADADTVVNLTNHAYFNLAGAGSGPVRDHLACINASRYTCVDDALIPTGEIAPVAGTPLDFTGMRPIGRDIDAETLRGLGGYDHNWALDTEGRLDRLAVRVLEPVSGRSLEMYSTEPGVQFFTANGFDAVAGKNGQRYERHGAFTLEAQHFPDSPHHAHFPETRLAAGEKYTQTTVYRFSPG